MIHRLVQYVRSMSTSELIAWWFASLFFIVGALNLALRLYIGD